MRLSVESRNTVCEGGLLIDVSMLNGEFNCSIFCFIPKRCGHCSRKYKNRPRISGHSALKNAEDSPASEPGGGLCSITCKSSVSGPWNEKKRKRRRRGRKLGRGNNGRIKEKWRKIWKGGEWGRCWRRDDDKENEEGERLNIHEDANDETTTRKMRRERGWIYMMMIFLN